MIVSLTWRGETAVDVGIKGAVNKLQSVVTILSVAECKMVMTEDTKMYMRL